MFIADFKRQLDEFWPYYLTQHRNPLNRRLHFIGNTHLLIWVTIALYRRSPALFAFAVASAYVIAWIGHFFFERNTPATFRYPVLAGVCDLIMYTKMWRGTLDAEMLER